MRIFSVLISLLLHAGMLAAMGLVLNVPWPYAAAKPFLELELAAQPQPAPPPVEVPAPRPVKPETVPPPSAPVKPSAKAPERMVPRLAAQGGRIVPPARPAPAPKAPAAPPGPPPKEISAAKTDAPPRNADPELEEFARSGGYVHPEAPDYLKHGSESRFGHVLGYYTYTIEQYVGQYSYDDGASTVTIIDARNTPYKRLLFYDSRTGIFRSLKQFGRYIYSYGPSFDQDEPVVGSLVFLANGDDISRILWMHGGKEAARFPGKTFFKEKAVTFSRGFTDLSGTLIVPPGEGPFPAVVMVAGPACGERKLQEASARQLSQGGVAVLVFDPRGCGASEDKPGGDAELADDALAAVEFVRRQAGVDGRRVGLFARREGLRAALLAAAQKGSRAPDFLVAAMGLPEGGEGEGLLREDEVRRLAVPTLWLFAGPDPAVPWRADLALLERAARPELSRVLLLPEENPSGEAPQWAREALRLERMSTGFVRFAAPWIAGR